MLQGDDDCVLYTKALLVIWVLFTRSRFYVCIAFSMDPLRSEIKLYYYYY